MGFTDRQTNNPLGAQAGTTPVNKSFDILDYEQWLGTLIAGRFCNMDQASQTPKPVDGTASGNIPLGVVSLSQGAYINNTGQASYTQSDNIETVVEVFENGFSLVELTTNTDHLAGLQYGAEVVVENTTASLFGTAKVIASANDYNANAIFVSKVTNGVWLIKKYK